MDEDLTPLPPFLREHYGVDYLEHIAGGVGRVATDVHHWSLVWGDDKKFPNADREWISNFVAAATPYSF